LYLTDNCIASIPNQRHWRRE